MDTVRADKQCASGFAYAYPATVTLAIGQRLNKTSPMSLSVQKIPAVMVDKQYVVYYEPEVPRAIGLIARARKSH